LVCDYRFIAGVIARFLLPGPNDPQGFLLTVVLGDSRRLRVHLASYVPSLGVAGSLDRCCVAGSTMPCAILRIDIARSWVARGPNRPISPEKLAAALGERTIGDLMQQTGMERDELLATLGEHLPRVIDHLTPEGRVPTDQEASRMA
jgi:hypothetical protein